MKLLVVTDHRFVRSAGGVFDTYCFDRRFFDDYAAVFDEVRVAARMRRDPPPPEAFRSDGEGVSFVDLPDVQGLSRVIRGSLETRRALEVATQQVDAVCLRIPAVVGHVAADIATRLGKPIMFELIGDPIAALDARNHGFIKALAGHWLGHGVRRVTRRAVAGSYVSMQHLQRRYPPGPQTTHDSISSIRLPENMLTEARSFDRLPTRMRIITVASFVPVKCHRVLIEAVARARDEGGEVQLELAGDGPLREALERQVRTLGLGEWVTFHGHVASKEQLRDLLDGSHLFAMTSANEGMPRAMIEAMARGVPAVGTRVGGIAEILQAEQLVEPGDSHALARLFIQIGRDAARLEAWSAYSVSMARRFLAPVLSARRRELLEVLRKAATAAGRGRRRARARWLEL